MNVGGNSRSSISNGSASHGGEANKGNCGTNGRGGFEGVRGNMWRRGENYYETLKKTTKKKYFKLNPTLTGAWCRSLRSGRTCSCDHKFTYPGIISVYPFEIIMTRETSQMTSL